MPDASNAPVPQTTESRFAILELSQVVASKTNPRKHFDQRRIDELAESIRTHGVAQPILVRPVPSLNLFEIVAGERRWRASKQLELATVPAMVRELTDLQALEIQVIENLQRADLHELEEAEGYEQLMKTHAFTAEQVAEKIGKSRSYVFARLKLLALCPAARKAFFDGELDSSTALIVARIPHEKLQREAIEQLAEAEGGAMSVRRAREYVQQTFMLRLADAPFSKKDPQLVPPAGPCTTCPKRTGNQPELFADVAGADVCTDPACFASKLQAFHDRAAEKAKADGARVIEGAEAEKLFPYAHNTSYMRGGFVPASSHNYDDGKQRKNEEIAKAAGIEPVFVRAPQGELVKAFEESKIRAAVKAANPRSGTIDDRQKATNRKVKVEQACRARILERLSEAAVGNMTSVDWRYIVTRVVERLWHDNQVRLLKLRGWDKAATSDRDSLAAVIDQLPDGDLAILMLQASLVGELGVNEYTLGHKADDLVAAAERHGVDVASIRKEVAAELAPRKPAKKVVAKKVTAEVRYRNEATGDTWTGRGKPPKWIEGKDRAPFKVQEATA